MDCGGEMSGELLYLHHQLENSSLAGPNLSENFLKVSKTLGGGSRTQKSNEP